MAGGPRDPGQPGRGSPSASSIPSSVIASIEPATGGGVSLDGCRFVRRAAQADRRARDSEINKNPYDRRAPPPRTTRSRPPGRVRFHVLRGAARRRPPDRSVATDGRGLEVARRRLRVDGDAATLREHQAEVRLGPHVTCASRQGVPLRRAFRVLDDAVSVLVEDPERELRTRYARVCRLGVIARCAGVIRLDAEAVVEARARASYAAAASPSRARSSRASICCSRASSSRARRASSASFEALQPARSEASSAARRRGWRTMPPLYQHAFRRAAPDAPPRARPSGGSHGPRAGR